MWENIMLDQEEVDNRRRTRQSVSNPPATWPAGGGKSPETSEQWSCQEEEDHMLSSVVTNLEQTIAHYRNLGSPARLKLAEAWIQLAGLWQQQEGHHKALRCYEESLSILEHLTPSEAVIPTLQALKQMGSLHYEMQHFPVAGQYFEEALRLTGQPNSRQSAPVKLEAAAMATLAAAIRMSTTSGAPAKKSRNATRRLLNLAGQYLENMEAGNDFLLNKRAKELEHQTTVLKRML